MKKLLPIAALGFIAKANENAPEEPQPDLINDAGKFGAMDVLPDSWVKIETEAEKTSGEDSYTYNFQKVDGDYKNYLVLKKKSSAPGAYDDGIYQYLEGTDVKPRHIHARMQTTQQSIESCDIRLTTITKDEAEPNSFKKVEWQDVAFFRFGYLNYQKMNLIDMVHKFTAFTPSAADVTPAAYPDFYDIDLIVNFDK